MSHHHSLLLLSCAIVLAACSPAEQSAPAPAPEPAAATSAPAMESEEALIARARGIHDRVITLDTHDDIDTSNFTVDNNYTSDLDTQVNLPKMIEGGLDVAWFSIYTGQGPLTEEGYAAASANALDKFAAVHRLAEEIAPDMIEIAYTSDDVRRIAASGKKVAMMGVENAYPMGLDVGNVKRYQELGARYMSLAHNGHSQFSDSNTGEADGVWLHHGLSDLGREAVMEMNRWGIMIDLSHPSKESNMQVLAMTKAPVIASHSSARTMNDVSRNLDDEQLLAIRDNNGVVQTTAFSSYLNSEKNSAHMAALNALRGSIAEGLGFEMLNGAQVRALSEADRANYQAKMAQVNELAAPRIAEEVDAIAPPVDVSDFVDHIDYMVGLIGIDHVGISSDFDGGGGITGWNDASETFNVTLELVRRGYTEEQINKLWSGNLLRVLDDVQRVAAEIQANESL
ncbi:MAG: dipeptidase [Pseudomonadales bacterium]|nr:dipeptidase [Pseudomonadales bacterium]MCP5358282.1 membrane dipeptidase [Pseudomonadales bacterium]